LGPKRSLMQDLSDRSTSPVQKARGKLEMPFKTAGLPAAGLVRT